MEPTTESQRTRGYSDRNHRGLGLSVACAIVRQSGGTMRILSAPGHGTTVSVLLPAL